MVVGGFYLCVCVRPCLFYTLRTKFTVYNQGQSEDISISTGPQRCLGVSEDEDVVRLEFKLGLVSGG